MKHVLRKVFAALFCAALSLSFTACLGEPPAEEVTVVAENRMWGDLVYTAYSDNTACITGYSGKAAELILPDTVDGYTLTAVADGVFKGCATLVTLRTGESLTAIGNEAFYQCSALATVELGGNVTKIGYYAFEETPWMESRTEDFVVAGDGVLLKYRGSGGEVIMPAGIKTLSDAFYMNEEITEVTLGPDVTEVGDYAFAHCTNLLRVNCNDKLVKIGSNAFAFCESLLEVKLGSGVQSLGEAAFFYCTMLRRFDGGEALTEIGENAFNYCNHLTTVRLGCGLRTIGDYAFYECYILRGVIYDGTESEWAERIDFGVGNSLLTEAARLYLRH